MSGSSWDYVYRHIEAAAERLDPKPEAVPRERRALGQLMRLVAKAMHDIEWVDSCDMSPGDELPAIRAALAPSKPLAAPPKPMSAEERAKAFYHKLRSEWPPADAHLADIYAMIREAESAARRKALEDARGLYVEPPNREGGWSQHGAIVAIQTYRDAIRLLLDSEPKL